MSDATPYVPEDLGADFLKEDPREWVKSEEFDGALKVRLHATVHALAAAQKHIAELEEECKDLHHDLTAAEADADSAQTRIAELEVELALLRAASVELSESMQAALAEAAGRAAGEAAKPRYVLCSGEYCEGHSPLSMHATLEAAVERAAMTPKTAALLFESKGRGVWCASINGVDEFWIYEMKVTP